ncbi:alpha/beta hydrolase [Nocardioides sp. Kera G14]|uniref:alpha/beta hydrolase n=1 Tax=Nocardioides sp. Kera G14 TaxID=2884264 RepID=UPI001D12EF24|nr:alpha/beta hydrolase [Nocardioides sp. Kera G14]UDY23818.1 alpha/beta hydrolase [Nocardioides sp. Kera G14]
MSAMSKGNRIMVWVLIAALVLGGLGAIIAQVVSNTHDDTSSTATEGSVPSASASASATPDPGSSVAPDPDLAKFYGQKPDWTSCRKSFQCATIEVPLDYTHPDGESIKLALLKVPASGKRVGSLVVNPGGPGAPGTDYAAQYEDAFGSPLHKSFDIVGFDPRGTGDSAPIDCLSDDQLNAYIDLDPDPDTAAEEAESFKVGQEFGKGCVAKSGELAAHVSTEEAARDMDVLRSALGESKLTYFGASYGTKLGATYADLFPSNVGRFVLDGAIDPSLPAAEMNIEQAKGFQTALDAYVDNCLSTSKSCFLGSTREAGEKRISDLLASLDSKPLPTSTGEKVTEGEAFLGIALPLYSRDYWVYLSQALKEAFGGSGDTLLLLADAYASREGDHFTDNSMEAIFAINCLDDSWALHTAAEVKAVTPQFLAASPTFGRAFAWMDTACAGSQEKTDNVPHELHAKGAAPILVIGTTRDPATPLQWAKALASQLDSGVLLTRDGDGHTGYNAGNDCVDSAVEDYLIKDVVPKDNTSC